MLLNAARKNLNFEKAAMADFTQKKYQELLHTLIGQNYEFQTFRDYLAAPKTKTIILRHDVDKRPANALTLAQIESKLGSPEWSYLM